LIFFLHLLQLGVSHWDKKQLKGNIQDYLNN
jgi:hypothetical protein